jgi:hypothetical protein
VRPEPLVMLMFLVACGGQDEPSAPSANPRVRPKSGVVWGRDLAQGLGLAASELCHELETVDCLTEAHLVTLGGVEPTELGIDEPLSNAAISAPIAADRVASAACGTRFDRDKQGPAVIFGPVLDSDNRGNRKDVAEGLVRRLLARDPSDAEVDAITDLYEVLEPISKNPTRDWSVGACVMVATSTESMFY